MEDGPGLGQERTIGTSVDPNSFGGLLAVLFALTLAQALGRRPCLPRPLLVGILGAEGLALLLTQSRAAWAGAAAAALLVGVLRYRRFAAVMILAGVLVLASGLGGRYLDRFISGVQLRDQAQLMRVAEFQNAGTIIARYPAFGVGFGLAGELDLTTGVSSIYLTLAERTGLLGLAAFVVQMGRVFCASCTMAAPSPPAGYGGSTGRSLAGQRRRCGRGARGRRGRSLLFQPRTESPRRPALARPRPRPRRPPPVADC